MSRTEFFSNHYPGQFEQDLIGLGREIHTLVIHAVDALAGHRRRHAGPQEEAFAAQVVGVEIERLQRSLQVAGPKSCATKLEQALLYLGQVNAEAGAIGRVARRLEGSPCERSLLDLPNMAGCVCYMLDSALEALVTGDPEMIEMVALAREQARAFSQQLRERLQSWLDAASDRDARPEVREWTAALLSVVGHLDTIGDGAAGIAQIACRQETPSDSPCQIWERACCACAG